MSRSVPSLKIIDPGGLEREIKLERDRYNIGRIPELNDIALVDLEGIITRQTHCLLKKIGGSWWIEDRSTNGTILTRQQNQVQLQELRNPEIELFCGDRIQRLEDSILSRFPYKRWLYESAKERAAVWLEKRAKLKSKGMDEQEIKRLGGIDEENAIILIQELEYREKYGMTDEEIAETTISKAYKLTLEDYEAFYQHFSVLHCIVIGLLADSLFLQRSFQTRPLLPNLLPSLLENLSESSESYGETVREIVSTYQHLYQSLESNFDRWIPEMMLDFALSLADLPDSVFALEQADNSVARWLKLNGIEQDKIFDLHQDEDCQLLKSRVYQEDAAYFNGLQKLIEKLENKDPNGNWVKGKSLLEGWKYLNRWGDIPQLPEIALSEAKTFESALRQQDNAANSKSQ